MMKMLSAVIAAGFLLVSVPAMAQDVVIQEEDRVVYQQTTVIDFNEVTLDGELTKPEGSYSIVRTRSGFSSLIKHRADFLQELEKSVDNL